MSLRSWIGISAVIILPACASTPSKKPLPPGFSKTAPVYDVTAECVATAPADKSPERKFRCKDLKGKTFAATCDVATDPLEFGIGVTPIDRAKWSKHGANEGIQGKFGFISCERHSETVKKE